MDKPNIFSGRIQHKTGTSADWLKAVNFVPLDGELIIYSDLNKVKIGDGSTNVNDLEFIMEEETIEIFNNLLKETALNTVKPGAGKGSVVVGEGSATGTYSVAGGSTDKSLAGAMSSFVGNITPAQAKGSGSLSFGANTESLVPGAISIGANTIAGCKGFYWFLFDFTNNIITLTTTQKRYSDGIFGVGANKNPVWDAAATNALKSWAVGDQINIVNSSKYTLCSTITAIDSTNGKITVDSLPFTEAKTALLALFDDYAVYCPSKPNGGVVDFGLGALAIGLDNKASGTMSSAIGYKNFAAGDFADVSGFENTAGYSAHAEGTLTKALGNSSHTEGSETIASAAFAHAEGKLTHAVGSRSHAEGGETISEGYGSHAEGVSTHAIGRAAHAEGEGNTAIGNTSHVEGSTNEASGKSAHAEGSNNFAYGNSAHVEGAYSKANGNYSHAEGGSTEALGTYSHAEGFHTVAVGNQQHVQGRYNILDDSSLNGGRGQFAHIVGNGTNEENRSNAHTVDWQGNAWFAGEITVGPNKEKLTGGVGKATSEGGEIFNDYENNYATNNSHAEGIDTEAHYISHAEGQNTFADTISHAEGSHTYAFGEGSHAEGYHTTADGDCGSHAEGSSTYSGSEGSHAEGVHTQALGIGSHAEGVYSNAYEESAHAEGYYTEAYESGSHAEGYFTIARCADQHVQGRYNIEDESSTYAHIVGNGTATKRSNAHTLDWDGNAWFAGRIVADQELRARYLDVDYVLNPQVHWEHGSKHGEPDIYSYEQHKINDDELAVDIEYSAAGVMSGNLPIRITGISEGIRPQDAVNKAQLDAAITNAGGGIGQATDSNGEIFNDYIDNEANAYAHAEGYGSHAEGNSSHSEGRLTIASGDASHAEGDAISRKSVGGTRSAPRAEGRASHAEGTGTVAGIYGDADICASHAEGVGSQSLGLGSHAEGYDTQAAGKGSHSEGSGTVAKNENDKNAYAMHAEGINTMAQGSGAHAEGVGTIAEAQGSHAEGDAISRASVGGSRNGPQALSRASHAEGTGTIAGVSGNVDTCAAHAEGIGSQATGMASHAEGYETISSGQGSHAEGTGTTASGNAAHAEGYDTTASGDYSHAEGAGTVASGNYSHAEGIGTIARGRAQHVSGQYNIEDTRDKYACIVGNGFSPQETSNAYTLDWDGNAWFAGGLTINGALNLNGTEDWDRDIWGARLCNPSFYYETGETINGVPDAGAIIELKTSKKDMCLCVNDGVNPSHYVPFRIRGISEGIYPQDVVNKQQLDNAIANALILQSPNGTKFQITVNDNGELSTIAI